MALKIIQVGMGGWGSSWAASIVHPHKEVELVACVDVVPAMLEHAREELSLAPEQCFTSLHEALATVACDAVLITANLEGHVPAAMTALQAGKHVLLEKPFAPTLAEAQQLVALAQQQQRILMISQNYRFHPAVQHVRTLLHEQALGPVGTVRLVFRKSRNTAPRESNSHYHIWQPLLADMSIHHFDLMRYILAQEATHIFCQAWNPPWSNFDGPASAAALITFSGGAIVNYQGSWVSTGPQTSWAGRWQIECARGEICLESRESNVPDRATLRLPGGEAEDISLPVMTQLDRHGSLSAFVQAVQNGEEPGSSGRDNLGTLALMLAAIESSNRLSVLPLAQKK